VISTTFNTGGEAGTDFRLPDLRGRVAAGKSDMGGSDAGILSGGGSLNAALGGQVNVATTNVSGATAGSLSVAASGISDNPFTGGIGASGGSGEAFASSAHQHAVNVAGGTSGSLTVSASGTSGAFSVVQPSRVLNYLIRI
jgi:microcystin-dependent protein